MSQSPSRLLLVENHGPLLSLLREVLERPGFEVDAASTATAAVNLLTERCYAAIVADCSLPDLPPLDWLAALRGAAPTTPLILFSGLSDLQDTQRLAMEFRAVRLLNVIIILKIKRAPPAFDVRADALVRLKQAGVSDRILEAMIARGLAGRRVGPDPRAIDRQAPELDQATRLASPLMLLVV